MKILQPQQMEIRKRSSNREMIDHCLTTKHQIFDTTLIEQVLGSDHFTQVFLSSLDIDYENN